MSFLDRFQNKIATVTAHGHLKKADGSEEIRVGPPKRKSQPLQLQANPASPHKGNQQAVQAHVQQSARGSHIALPLPKQVDQQRGKHQAPQPEQAGSHSARHVHPSPNVSPRSKTQRDYYDDNNHSHYPQLQQQHPQRYHEQQYVPGRPDGEYGYYEKPSHGRPSPGKGNSPDRQRPQQTEPHQSHPQQQSYQQLQQPMYAQDRGGPQSKSPRGKNAPPQDEFPSPRERNEARVQSDEDQLAFSRKARPVQFAPCTLSQYKKEKPAGYYELGKLQPDLNADELVQKRANLERIKSFSKNLRAINMSSAASKKPDPDPKQLSQKRANSSREKALEFSKHVPKPRLQQRPLADSSGLLSTNSSTDSLPVVQKPRRLINSVPDDDVDDDGVSSALQQLQMRHQASRAQVEALMRNV